ncbi:hypothetical protein ElyMa_006861300 [Elysia marginata]|uniref:Uncharacterized protein n=1 Tax=Elysia marginata TaxID=1093978 RepID=A0AAV4JEJ3_9GAST|nr:hypothetical protein ElyMa_006861300 [Elysia marginata]
MDADTDDLFTLHIAGNFTRNLPSLRIRYCLVRDAVRVRQQPQRLLQHREAVCALHPTHVSSAPECVRYPRHACAGTFHLDERLGSLKQV